MPTSAWELDLPLLNTNGLDRLEALKVTRELARDHWLVRSEMGFTVLRYEDDLAVLRDPKFFSFLKAMNTSEFRSSDSNRGESILSMEGPDHLRLRRLVAPAFSPAAAAPHRPMMREIFEELLTPFLASGGGDFVSAVAEPYPIPIICRVLGAPREDWQLFSDWATDIFKIFNGNLAEDMPAIEKAGKEIGEYVGNLIEQRRHDLGDDLLSALIVAEEEGDRLDHQEMVRLAEAVLLAGTDTTRNQLGCTMAVFAEYPDQWRLLQERPELAPKAVEESMRYLGAVRGTGRVASEDITYRDVVFTKGTMVSTNFAAGNRDQSVFAEPDEFNIAADREVQQLTFGSGVHRCLGAALARAELQEALTLMAERIDSVTLAGPVTWKPPTFGIWGPASLPLSVTTR